MTKTQPETTRHRVREVVTLSLLVVFYLVCSFRFFPDRWAASVVETLIHILSVAPFTGGLTLVLIPILRRAAGQELSLGLGLRIFLTLGIAVELFYGLYNYLSLNQAP